MLIHRIRRYFVFIVLLGLSACVSDRWKDFSEVKLGMNKSEVLSYLGNPDRTQRWQGKDRWIYDYQKSGGVDISEVHFEDGKVVYSGPPIPPKISAEEQDRLNEEYNRKAEIEEANALENEHEMIRSKAKKIQESPDVEEKPVPVFEQIQ